MKESELAALIIGYGLLSLAVVLNSRYLSTAAFVWFVIGLAIRWKYD